jgi:hypothetical protein
MFRVFIQDVTLNCTRQLCRNPDGSLSWWEADGYRTDKTHAFETREEAEAILAEADAKKLRPYGCIGHPRIENWEF